VLRALIVTTAGINCDQELAEAFQLVGAEPSFVHLKKLLAKPKLVEQFELIGLPGGFSYGDAVAAGRIAAQLMRRELYPAFVQAVERGVPIIAPCNGFQIAVQMGLLPGPEIGASWPALAPPPVVALSDNESARFIDKWVEVTVPDQTRCIWTSGLSADSDVQVLPIAHGEGRFMASSERVLESLERTGQIAIRYAAHDNPNGSSDNIAGICDASGLVLGLMPHPERYTVWENHPTWTRLPEATRLKQPFGIQMFHKAAEHARSAAVL